MSIEAIGLGLTFITAVVVAVWTLSNKISGIKSDLASDISKVAIGLAAVTASVNIIMTNHLVHLPEEVAKAIKEAGGDYEQRS